MLGLRSAVLMPDEAKVRDAHFDRDAHFARDTHVAAVIEQDVLNLAVAVHDAVGPGTAAQGRERFANAARDVWGWGLGK